MPIRAIHADVAFSVSRVACVYVQHKLVHNKIVCGGFRVAAPVATRRAVRAIKRAQENVVHVEEEVSGGVRCVLFAGKKSMVREHADKGRARYKKSMVRRHGDKRVCVLTKGVMLRWGGSDGGSWPQPSALAGMRRYAKKANLHSVDRSCPKETNTQWAGDGHGGMKTPRHP